MINWSQATVIDSQPEGFTRWIEEAVDIRKEGQQAVNRDEGSYSPVTHTTAFLTRHFHVASKTGRISTSFF